MATTPTPPAARKTPARTKRTGPTKAQALKALGLTKEDLETLKLVAQARNAADGDSEREKLGQVVGHQLASPTPSPDFIASAQQDAKIKAYNALKEAGLAIPAELATEVETYPSNPAPSEEIPSALKSAEERKEEAEARDQPFFIRNLRGTDFGFRLSRQKTGKRTDLKPRGQRGDLERLEKEDYGDPELERQIQYGCVEIITLAEAKEIIAKQAHNHQAAVHPAMAMLRNELDQPYAQGAVKVVPEFNSQGITVAQLDPRQMQGQLTDKEVARAGGLERVNPQQSITHAPLGGNPSILNDGFARQDTAAARDAIARQRGLEGPAAGGIQRVVVEAPQKG